MGSDPLKRLGFEDRALTKGKKVIMGTPFVTVGQTALNLQDIKIKEDIADEAAMIWWWNSDSGKYNQSVVWVSEMYDKDNDDEVIVDENGNNVCGWADADWYPVEKTFDPGDAFWIQLAGNINATITFSGEILEIDSSSKYCGVELTKGKKVQLANPFPSTLNLQDIKILEDIADEAAMIWWWDTAIGKYNPSVVWVSEMYDKDNDDEVIVDENGNNVCGWADADWYPVEKVFEAGEAFWVQLAGNMNATIQFPNPLYKAEDAK